MPLANEDHQKGLIIDVDLGEEALREKQQMQ